MLVITRRMGESISIDLGDGREIVVSLTAVNGDRVRLGVSAPSSVSILRDELVGGVEAANRVIAHTQRIRMQRLVSQASAITAEASS